MSVAFPEFGMSVLRHVQDILFHVKFYTLLLGNCGDLPVDIRGLSASRNAKTILNSVEVRGNVILPDLSYPC